MESCPFEKYFGEYIDGELEKADELKFLQHIQDCPTCPDRLDSFYETHRILKKIHRLQPDKMFLNGYAARIDHSFRAPSLVRVWYYSIEDLLNRILPSSRWWRFATIIAVLIAGIFIGRYVLKPVQPDAPINSDVPYLWDKPVSAADIEYINYYLLASEMIILELENINPADSDILISKETAQKLLMKTFMVHESALQLNFQQLLRFLTKMELILYELANAESGENEQIIESIRMVINESDLLDETRRLQKIIEDTRKG